MNSAEQQREALERVPRFGELLDLLKQRGRATLRVTCEDARLQSVGDEELDAPHRALRSLARALVPSYRRLRDKTGTADDAARLAHELAWCCCNFWCLDDATAELWGCRQDYDKAERLYRGTRLCIGLLRFRAWCVVLRVRANRATLLQTAVELSEGQCAGCGGADLDDLEVDPDAPTAVPDALTWFLLQGRQQVLFAKTLERLPTYRRGLDDGDDDCDRHDHCDHDAESVATSDAEATGAAADSPAPRPRNPRGVLTAGEKTRLRESLTERPFERLPPQEETRGLALAD